MFSKEKANEAITFIEHLTHTKGEWAGQPFKLNMAWQIDLITQLFGNVDEQGNRIYRKCYCEISKKNGKSELAAAIALYLLFADGEQGAEIYSAAADHKQASIVFNVAAQMVRQCPELHEICKILDSQKRIVFYQTASFYQVLSADVKTKHGINAHGVIFDELHAQPTRDLWDVLTVGSGAARRQPLIFAITTAGYDRESICYEQHQYATDILHGTFTDDRFLPIVFSLNEQDDWENEENWKKVNPAIGTILKIEDLRAEYLEAKQKPAMQNVFRRLHLNQWTQQSDRWIDYELWKSQGGEPIKEQDLIERECYGGLDLSAVSDLTAWAMTFPNDDGSVDVLCRFWCPESKLYDSTNKYREQYQVWRKQGFLTPTPGDAIDYDFIIQTIIEDGKKFHINSINIDRLFQGYHVAMELEDAGFEVSAFAMGHKSFSIPMKEFEKRLLDKKIHHGNNPVLNWMIDNVAVKADVNNNLMPDKVTSQGKIDGVVALVLAMDRLVREDETASVYEKRGVLVF